MSSPGQNPELKSMNSLIDIQEFLNHFQIFSGAPAGVMGLFAYLAKKEEYTEGQSILKEGESSDRCFLILSGNVDIFQNHSGRRFHLQLLSQGGINYFGELALLSEFEWFFSARAWTTVQLLSISREAFAKVMERYPDYYQTMVQKIISSRIHRFAEQSRYLLDHIAPEAWRDTPPTDAE